MMGIKQLTFEDYDGFVEKFKTKKTTDDCYTPDYIYDAVLEWVCEKYGVDPAKVVRPFWPGGDYLAYDYPPDAVVVDNPPFSILSQIVRFYLIHNIEFFLFAPALNMLWMSAVSMVNHIVIDTTIVYENGVKIQTGFITSFGDNIIESAPELDKQLKIAMAKHPSKNSHPKPTYVYPSNVVRVSRVSQYSKYGIDFAIKRSDAKQITILETKNGQEQKIYGGGLLLNENGQIEYDRAEHEYFERERIEREQAGQDADGKVQLFLRDRDRLSIPYIGKGVQR